MLPDQEIEKLIRMRYVDFKLLGTAKQQWEIADMGLIEKRVFNSDDCSVLKVSLKLKDIQKYRIDTMEKGIVISDDEEKHLCSHYNKLGVIKDDFYLTYKNGIYSLLILITWINGWRIQVDCNDLEIITEKMG